MLLVDAHLDLSMNAMEWNRDLTRPIDEIRQREKDMIDKPDRGKGVVNFEELRKGNIGLVVATQIAPICFSLRIHCRAGIHLEQALGSSHTGATDLVQGHGRTG